MQLKFVTSVAAGILSTIFSANASAQTWQLTYELPGVQNTTATFSSSQVETFDTRTIGVNQSFTSTVGSYTGVTISAANQYGGAGGVGRYATRVQGGSTTLVLSQDANYFGYWLSALDAGNVVAFFDGLNKVGEFNAGSVLSQSVTGNAAYSGNPTAPFLGVNVAQSYAFVNFFATGVGNKFNQVVFTQTTANSGYETDNHTVGLFTSISGVAVVPEPASYLLFCAGLLGLGAFVRKNAKNRT